MTSEIAIMNKTAVALAADSAVTLETQNGQKIYNTANKLFSLSKHRPIGIMVFGGSEFMGVPWESIIKIYRHKLNNKKFDNLENYAKEFILFLDDPNPLFPETVQKNFFYDIITGFFYHYIIKEIDAEVKTITDNKKKIALSQIEEIVTKVINKHHEKWTKYKFLPNLSNKDVKRTIRKYGGDIKKAKEEVFQDLPVSQKSFDNLKTICANIFLKDAFRSDSSGIVIAGFGEKDVFPSIISYEIEVKMNNKLKYKHIADKSHKINFKSSASIISFAQGEMVQRFMAGVDPGYDEYLAGYLFELFDKYPSESAEVVELNSEEKKKFIKKLKKEGAVLFSNLIQGMEHYKRKEYVNPILDAVAALPKDELSSLAEALVNLQSVKRKISMDAETVGGPIDVAVISKGDGFIWIKRKHYFKPELNPNFFANYYQKK